MHHGKAPRWLFNRMTKLARAVAEAVVQEFGTQELLARLSHPGWFQSLGCLMGFDWHSSGLTTTLTGALKQGLASGLSYELGFFSAGGKGATSRKTPTEIREIAERVGFDPEPLILASRMSAKVDSAALQDGYQLYHHAFFFDKQGNWCVVQQGLNDANGYARRYHWLSDRVQSFVEQPHAAIASRTRGFALDLTATSSADSREVSTQLASRDPHENLRDINHLFELNLPRHHRVLLSEIKPGYLRKTLLSTYATGPENFQALLATPGVGSKTIRALALVGDVLYGARPSFQDPRVYSFAHGGKDGHPYPVNRKVYDRSILVLERAIRSAKLGRRQELEALRRLSALFNAS